MTATTPIDDVVDRCPSDPMGRGRTRPRGFVPWTPQSHTLALLDQVDDVLEEYRSHLPLTVRQVFYRLVGAHGYPKTEQDYKKLGEVLVRARRAHRVPMDAIREGGTTRLGGPGWSSSDAFVRSCVEEAKRLRLDRTAGQKVRLVVMCEAAGMAPQLARIVGDYDVQVFSSGGFESITEKHDFAAMVAADDRPVEVLHLGDRDPSGEHLFVSLAEDVQAFCDQLGGEVAFTRLALP
jgi:hypothetical protein